MMVITFDFQIYIAVLICVGIVTGILEIFIGLRPLHRAYLAVAASDNDEMPGEASGCIPKVSVIIYVPGSDEEMERCVTTIMKQDYPDFEIICVREASAEVIKDARERYRERFPKLYMTFIPPESKNLSHVKLALTIGIKAAGGEIILITSPECVPDSSSWISEMASPFADSRIDMVLGYSKEKFSDMRGVWRWYRQYDSIMTSASWIAAAYGRHAYRGDGSNLAFRKSFFEHTDGYVSFRFLHSGEDDIFVSRNSTEFNTALQLSPLSRMTVRWGNDEPKMWERCKDRYDFTSRYLPRKPFVLAGLSSVLNWTVTLAFSLAAVLPVVLSGNHIGIPVSSFISIVALFLFWTVEILVYRKCAESLGAVRLWCSLPLFMLLKPMVNFFFRLLHRRDRVRNYTWIRQ